MKILLPYYLILEYLLILRIKIDEKIHKEMPSIWNKKSKKTVILLPGVHSQAHGLKKIGNAVNKKGYQVLTLEELGNNTMKVAQGAKILENFLRHNKLSNVTIIAHSKGGLIAKYFIDNSQLRSKVEKIISISTPYKGSIMAYLIGDKDMFPDSEVIRNFKVNNNSIFTQLYPLFDNHVIPNRSLILEGANNIKISEIGHTRILFSTITLKIIDNLLH